MADDNPYAKYAPPASANPYGKYGLPANAIMVAPPTPGYGNLQPKSDEELRAIRLANQRAAAQAPHDAQNADADATLKQLQVQKATQEAADADAARMAANMTPNAQVHGDDYLRRFVPPAQWDTVKALARGDLGSRTGVSKSLLPLLQHAMNYDPTMSGTSFPARVKMQGQLADGNPTSIGGSLRSMEQMLLHGSDTLDHALDLDNWHSGITAPFNYAKTLRERMGQDPKLSAFNKSVENYAPESQKAIAGVAGGVNERGDRAASLSANMSPEAIAAGLQSDAKMAMDRIGAVNDQYRRVMGRDITDQLSPAAKAAYDKIMAGGYGKDGKPLAPAAGWTPISGGTGLGGSPPDGSIGSPGGLPSGGFTPSGPSVGVSLATGASRTVDNTRANAIIDSLIRAGASDEQISAAIQPLGFGAVDPRQTSASRAYLKAHPGYQGSFGGAQAQVPTTAWNRFAASPVGTGIFGAADASVGGLTDEFASMVGGGDLADLNARKQAAFAANPKSAFIGQAAGTIGSMYGLGALGRATGLASRVPQLAGDIAFGAASGAGQDNDNRVLGAALGAAGGLGGHYLGQGAASGIGAVGRTAPGRAVTGMFGRGAAAPATPLTSAEQAVFSAANRGGLPNVRASLTEAGQLGVPMTLADTTTGLRSLAGAAVRRSPAAAQMAEDVLIPRARGQVDRFGSAVTRDLGPTANIPQQSEALTQQARAAAAPLYDQAYAQSVPHTPEFEAVLNTPFGQQALARARTIAANERRSPQELGFALDANGNTVLNPHPSQQIADHMSARAALDDAQAAYRTARTTPGADMTAAANHVEAARQQMRTAQSALDAAPDPTQAASVPAHTQQTLDYVKRGMDDVLEEQRNKITGRLDLDEAGRAQNQVRGQLLTENDRLNPAFAQARAAYAGPAQARDALFRGQDAYRLGPDELQMQVGVQSPEHIDQMRLGDRSQLVENARSLRDATNPFDAASTLGSPAARARLSLLHGGAADTNVDRLLRQADIERSLARTNNKVLGNSDTAERTLADKAFGYASWAVPAAMDMGLMAMGHVPLATAARLAATGGVRDAFTMGLGRRAVAKADELAPMLFNSDPAAGVSALDGLATKDQLWREYVARTTPKRVGGMFGRGIGSQALVAPLTYGTP